MISQQLLERAQKLYDLIEAVVIDMDPDGKGGFKPGKVRDVPSDMVPHASQGKSTTSKDGVRRGRSAKRVDPAARKAARRISRAKATKKAFRKTARIAPKAALAAGVLYGGYNLRPGRQKRKKAVMAAKYRRYQKKQRARK